MHKLIKIIIFSFVIFNFHNIYSQSNTYRFDRITNADGLSSNSVFAIMKDNSGFIWVGGEYGLDRYDGNTVKVYTPFNSKGKMSDGWIQSLCDDENFIWIGTMKGLNKFNKIDETFILYQFDSLNEHSIPSNQMSKVIKRKNGDIWISTVNGLCKYNRANNNFIRFKNEPDNEANSISSDFVQTIFEDSEENLWIGTNNGLDILVKGDEVFKHYKNIPGDEFSLSSNVVSCIFEDSKGNMWISTANGVDRFERNKNKFYKLIDQRNANSSWGSDIANIKEDNNNNIWLASSSIGITIYNPQTNYFNTIVNNPNDNKSLCGNYIATLVNIDSTIWIGSSGGGLSTYNPRKWKFDHYRSIMGDSGSLSSSIVWSVCEDKDRNIWAATNTGLNIFERSKGRFIHINHDKNNPNSLSDDNIRYIYRDKSNNMWVVSIGYALEKFIPEMNGFKHYNDTNGRGYNGTYFLEDKKGNYWLGCWNGIRVFDKNMNLIRNHLKYESDVEYFLDKPIMSIYEDKKNNIWISTLYGLFFLDVSSDKLTKFENIPDDSTSLSHSSAVAVINDDEGFFWITTYGGGLNKYNPKTSKFKHITEKQGLPHNVVYSIVEDDFHKYWINSNKGIFKFDPKTETSTIFGIGDGVQELEFASASSYKSERGEIFFGGINGFNGFIPAEMPVNTAVPKIALTSFKIFNEEAQLEKSINYTEEIYLSYWDNFFTFEFASLDYTNPHNNKCMYMLEGIDKNWVEAGNEKIASYTNISPGKYTFRVIGSNNDGVWNNEGKKVTLTISPPWWQTLWFKGLSVITFLFIVGFVLQRKYSQLKKEQRNKEEFARQLISSQEAERKVIAHELHDSLAQELLVVKNKAILTIRNPVIPDEVKKNLRDISEGISSTMEQVREISHKLKPYEIERFGLTHSLEILIEKLNNNGFIKFTSDIINIDKLFIENDEINIFRIIQECFNNILKHSKAKNSTLLISKDENLVSIFISDDGKGFDTEKVLSKGPNLSFGLSGITERVSLMKGKTNIKSHPGKGTLFEIIIPYK